MLDNMEPRSREFITSVCDEYEKYNQIDPIHYENYNVKRGLRNADGTGILAGITKIGSVQGYIVRDGEREPIPGKLYYRGIDIHELINGFDGEDRMGFEETCFLLLFGHLPNREQLVTFYEMLETARELPNHFFEDMIINSPSVDVMNKLARAILALYSYDQEPEGNSLANVLRQSLELVARVPILVSHAYSVKRHYFDHESLVVHHPSKGLSIAENFLRGVRPNGQFTHEEARLLDICMVLHAEHGGGNNSAFACRVLTSSGTDTYSSLSAAVGSLKGPKHGGANAKVMEMFSYIRKGVKDWKDDDEVNRFLTRIVQKTEGDGSGLIYGMGHAVYTLSDPRAVILKDYAKKLVAKGDMLDEFLLMESVERLTPGILAKVKGDGKIVSANVDMYSGLVYHLLGIPEALYTPIFAIARTVGWCAHRIEELLSGGRIMRPAYRSVVSNSPYIPLQKR